MKLYKCNGSAKVALSFLNPNCYFTFFLLTCGLRSSTCSISIAKSIRVRRDLWDRNLVIGTRGAGAGLARDTATTKQVCFLVMGILHQPVQCANLA